MEAAFKIPFHYCKLVSFLSFIKDKSKNNLQGFYHKHFLSYLQTGNATLLSDFIFQINSYQLSRMQNRPSFNFTCHIMYVTRCYIRSG